MTAQQHNKAHLEPYPALRRLSDEQLVEMAFHALCPDDYGDGEKVQAECERCGCEFEYVKQGNHNRLYYDDCVKFKRHHRREIGEVNPDVVGPCTWVKCTTGSEFYRQGVCRVIDFDWSSPFRGADPFIGRVPVRGRN